MQNHCSIQITKRRQVCLNVRTWKKMKTVIVNIVIKLNKNSMKNEIVLPHMSVYVHYKH